MNPLRAAIYDLLNEDTTLSTLAPGGIHWRQVDTTEEDTVYPLVIFDKLSGTRLHAFAGNPMRPETYLVKGVGYADDAEEIDERCCAILSGAALDVEGRVLLMKPLAGDDVGYSEDTDGETYEHVGTTYRITTERASS